MTVLLLAVVIAIGGCKTSVDTPDPPTPPQPPPPPAKPTEQLIGTMFFHDNGPSSQYDIYSGELYIVPKASAADSMSAASNRLEMFSPRPDGNNMVRRGIHKFHNLEVEGRVRERVVLNIADAVDITQYDFELRDVENITNSDSDDFAVNINENNWITFVTAPDGLATNRDNTEIVYMDLVDRVRHPLTPINGNYSGLNWDPDWKTADTIVWSHDGKFVEVNINDLDVSDPIIPDVTSPLFDPKYSPDRSMILYNTRQNRKKNSYIRYLDTGQNVPVLPTDYFNAYTDDNPTWVFSNSQLTGHIYIDNNGRIYTRDIDSGDFLIITDGARDFRYVTPLMLDSELYLVFSDWTDDPYITLWIANENGSVLRELNHTGDEVVFRALGFSAPRSEEDMLDIARRYTDMFAY